MATSAAYIEFDEQSSAPSTPDTGKVRQYAKSDGKLYQKDDAGTETDLTATTTGSSGSPYLGHAATTAPQTDISTQADITGLSATVTVPANHIIRITGMVRAQPTDSGARAIIRIAEGATNLQIIGDFYAPAANKVTVCYGSVIPDSPSAGSHTYKLTAELASGSGTIGIPNAATAPGQILVEDLGPAS